MSPGVSVDPDTLGWGGSSMDHGDPQMSVDPASHLEPHMSVDPGSLGWGGSCHAPDPGMSVDPSAAEWGGMSHAADPGVSADPSLHHSDATTSTDVIFNNH
ncbi:hypothetical protein FF36_03580 [Frankia torreyi]|uniref:Uncharacterized protein n=2 Tax=Frankia TaxID=1854 RepID=A0A0D8BCY2_9ACTN|nr:hypothetical protein FF36_03580 [Frankia torreyi]KQM04244.1 hypothetical protein FF86_102817 [Frankia sp. CpI1-P]